jgi:hypothetical protein
MSRSGYQTDERILCAIEALTQGNMNSRDIYDPAISLWAEGGREDEIRVWLDEYHPEWRDEAPLHWGEEEFK